MLKSYKDKSKNKPYIIVEISDKIMVNIMKKVRQILNIDSLHKNNIMGENVTVAVLDTGIYNHPDFGERIIKYKDFVNGKTAIYDDEGHGTHVTGILAGDGKMSNGFFKGIVPNADIVSLKVLDKDVYKRQPLLLPDVESYEPTGTGESPLAAIDEWVNTTCPCCGKPAKRETNTMPQWAGSSWYFLRYIDNKNDKELVSREKADKYLPVDMYIGGVEHAVLHLLYSRFYTKFLHCLLYTS